jgi:hypothetical protein
MKMFGLFEKKRDVAMTVYILSLMNTYLKQCKGDIVLVKDEPGLTNELKKLESLGLGSSENAKLLRAKIKELENKRENSKFGQEVFEFIKELGSIFPSSYLISFDQFYDILKKYKLTVDRIHNYTGIIPQKNIEEISEIKKRIEANRERCEEVLNYYTRHKSLKDTYNRFYYVNKIRVRFGEYKELAKSLKKVLSDKGFLVKYSYGSDHGVSSIGIKDAFYSNDWIDEKEYRTRRSDDILLIVRKLDHTDLLIAAPENSFSEKFKITQMPVDPIVFQCCPYGVIVHSVWGEEADDKVLEEYKTLNQKILEL